MPSKKQYDLVLDSGIDVNTDTPSEETFKKGLNFHAKLIGTRDVPRPSSRVEIVAAMRRIRYECKVKSLRKTKVIITISVNGIAVSLSKSARKMKRSLSVDDSSLLLHKYPIFRIFYVSHDSQDLQIFSYIARDDASDTFQCSVFKSYKRNQATHIVRTIGQAFDVCHKVPSTEGKEGNGSNDVQSDTSELNTDQKHVSSAEQPTTMCQPQSLLPDSKYNFQSLRQLSAVMQSASGKSDNTETPVPPPALPASYLHRASVASHGYKLLREQLTLQTQQTQVLMAEVQLLRNNLASETTMRQDLQTRTQDLLLQNRELIDHIDVLVNRLAELEASRSLIETSGVQRLMRLSGLSSPVEATTERVINNGTRYSLAHSFSYLEPTDFSNGISSSKTAPIPLSSASYINQSQTVQNSCVADGLKKPTSNWLHSTTESMFQEEPVRPIILPLSLQDATGNRLELGGGNYGLPRIKPPPKINRDPSSQTSNPTGKSRLTQPGIGSNSENRYSWGYRTSIVANCAIDSGAVSTASKLQTPNNVTSGLNCSAYTIGGANASQRTVGATATADGGVSPSDTAIVSLSSCGGFDSQLETSYCENDSMSSTAELKLSFSDDECFVDVPASRPSKKS